MAARCMLRGVLQRPTTPHNRLSSMLQTRSFRYGYDRTEAIDSKDIRADFRSDTVTKPTEGMRKAMAEAENIGDDVYREDRVVEQLEAMCAERSGKEAALFCASGTMANQLALRSQLQALQSLICDDRAHIYTLEAAGVAYHSRLTNPSQAQAVGVARQAGEVTITGDDVRANYRDFDVHHAVTAGVALENTFWGEVVPMEKAAGVRQACDSLNLFLHLDGARVPNACVAQKASFEEVAKPFDSISLCLSKSLGCPIGSVVLGSQALIDRARHFRKLFGGGWRQAGILAAAGVYALENNWERLAEDHTKAAYLSDLLTGMGFTLEVPTATNQVWLNSKEMGVPIATFADAWRKEGLLVLPHDEYGARLVTHLQTPVEQCEKLVGIAARVAEEHHN